MLTDKKKYNQEYYKKNRIRLLADWKKRYYNPETYGTRKSVLEYQKRYRKTHKKKIKETNKKHNFDYPSGAECPYCVMDATDQFKPDKDAEFIMTEEEPEWVKKLKLNLKLAYWKLRNELYELGQWIRLLWSY